MNEMLKYATFSIELLGKTRVNSMFSMGRARIFYIGPNPNRVIIEGDAAKTLASSIPGTPIIGSYNNITQDFEGHEDNQIPYGFVPLQPNYTWVDFDENGKQRQYLETDVVIWDGRFSEAKLIFDEEKSLSMELNPETMTGTFEKIDGKTYYRVSHADFAGITVLGDAYEPCFKDAKFLTSYSKMVSEYSRFVEDTQEQVKGGIGHMNIEEFVGKFRLSADEKAQAVVNAFCEANEISGDDAYYVFALELYDDYAVLYDCRSGKTKRAYYSVGEGDVVSVSEVVEVKITDVTEEENAKLDEMKNRYELLESEVTAKEEEVKSLGEQVQTITDEKIALEAEVAAKAEELETVKTESESKQTELEAAQEVVKQYSKKEKQAIINKFSTKLEDEELITELSEKIDELSEEDIKAKLGEALAEQVLAEESTDGEPSNFTLNVNVEDNNMGNSVWDIVRRHKNNK
jgi:hypothetical protein